MNDLSVASGQLTLYISVLLVVVVEDSFGKLLGLIKITFGAVDEDIRVCRAPPPGLS